MGHWSMAQGSVAIPTREMPKVRKAFIDLTDAYRNKVHLCAEKVIEAMASSIGEGRRMTQKEKAIYAVTGNGHSDRLRLSTGIDLDLDDLMRGVLKRNQSLRDMVEPMSPAGRYIPESHFQADVVVLINRTIPKGARYYDPRKARKITQKMLFEVIPKSDRKNPKTPSGDARVEGNAVIIDVAKERDAVGNFMHGFVGDKVYRALNRIDYGKRKDRGGTVRMQDEISAEEMGGPSVMWRFGGSQ